MNNKAIFSRSPLPPQKYAALPLTAIRPAGWLKQQLRVQADGLSGHLYEFWDSVSDKCQWLGGDGDAWERAPYYLDGMLPLAYELSDERLIAKAQEYVEWMLASQREDGFFGPECNTDWWPRSVALKALQQYYTATTDERVPTFMLKYFAYEYKHLEEQPLQDWAVARGADTMVTVLWLYRLTGKAFLLKLAKVLAEQTLDWTGFFATFPYTRSMAHILPWKEYIERAQTENEPLTGHDRPFLRTTYHFSHVVNVAMALKNPAMCYLIGKEPAGRDTFNAAWNKLMRSHGVATGMFTGDEHLSGNSPTQGTELCAVVEAMYSMETLLHAIGDLSIGDKLEKLAFNALPGTFSPDMRAHQYVQQVNQVRATNDHTNWYNNGTDANIFGLEPNFGCCTANMHQGFPKFVEHLWMATSEGGLACVSYCPCDVRFTAGGENVSIHVKTEYPFGESVRIEVCPANDAEFPIELRVPAWCDRFTATVNGETFAPVNGIVTIRRKWTNGDAIEVTLPMQPRLSTWYHQSRAVDYGPLLMVLPINGEKRVIADHGFTSDFELLPASEWNYGLVEDGSFASRKAVRTGKPCGFAFGVPLTLSVAAVKLPEWGMKGVNCDNPPIDVSYKKSDVREVRLVPYGATMLRIGQFPYLTKTED